MKHFVMAMAMIAGLAPTLGLAAGGKGKIKGGMWEMTMDTQMEGLQFAMPAVTVKQCVSPDNAVPMDEETAKHCTVKKQKVTGNKVSWEMECNQPEGKTTGSGEMTFTGTTCKGFSNMTVVSDSGAMKMKTQMSGRWLGACDTKKMAAEERRKQDEMEALSAAGKAQQASWEAREGDVATAKQFISRLKVPAEKPGACSFYKRKGDDSLSDSCASKFGPLAINDGEWEITTEQVIVLGELVNPIQTSTTRGCFGPGNPYGVKSSEPVKRNGNVLTWKDASGNGVVENRREGGIEYQGDRLAGAHMETSSTSYGEASSTSKTYTRITGKRIGSGNCAASGRIGSGREYSGRSGSGRAYSGVSLPAPPPEPAPESNPARAIRNYFGW